MYDGQLIDISYTDVWSLEDHFKAILPIKCTLCEKDNYIHDLGTYRFQFTGVKLGGRRFICINAFESNESDLNEAVIVCDGGTSFWHALYDIDNKVFSHIEVNAEE